MVFSGSVATKDFEDVFYKIVDLFRNNYNTILAEIDTHKNDGIILDQVNTNAFFSDPDVMPNYDPYMFFDGITEDVDNNIVETLEGFTILVQLHKANTNDDTYLRRVMRYQKAMIKLVERFYNMQELAIKIAVKRIDPIDIMNKELTVLERRVVSIELFGNIA